MDQQEHLSVAERASEVVNDPHNAGDDRRLRRPLTHHLVFLSAIALPITLISYLAFRRGTSNLHMQLNKSNVAIARLQRDLKTTMLENALRRDEYTRIRGSLTEMKHDIRKVNTEMRQEWDNLDVELRQNLKKLRDERDQQLTAQEESDIRFRSDLQAALDEAQKSRSAQIATQRELGTSLAEVAAFMHEQTLSQGRQNLGIERLRWFAHSLQSPSETEDTKPTSNRDSH